MTLWSCGSCGTRYSVGATRCPHCGAQDPYEDGIGPVPPSVTVFCPGQECPQLGIRRRVQLRLVALNVVELPRLLCTLCGRELNVTWPGAAGGEDPMPKITVHGGASNAADETPEEEPCPGSSLPTSTEKPQALPETSDPGPEQPARMTASRSKKARTGSSSVPSTDGDPTDDSSAPDAR